MVLPPKNVTFSPCFSSSTVSGGGYYLIRLNALGGVLLTLKGCLFSVEGCPVSDSLDKMLRFRVTAVGVLLLVFISFMQIHFFCRPLLPTFGLELFSLFHYFHFEQLEQWSLHLRAESQKALHHLFR